MIKKKINNNRRPLFLQLYFSHAIPPGIFSCNTFYRLLYHIQAYFSSTFVLSEPKNFLFNSRYYIHRLFTDESTPLKSPHTFSTPLNPLMHGSNSPLQPQAPFYFLLFSAALAGRLLFSFHCIACLICHLKMGDLLWFFSSLAGKGWLIYV